MIEQQVNKASKALLAKLLATENITVRVDPMAKTASFDMKRRILTLPNWQNISETLHDMLQIHETGHALDTPKDGWVEAIDKLFEKFYPDKKDILNLRRKSVAQFLNVLEDVRVDKKQKRRYPGSKRDYLLGYKELIDRDLFGTAGQDINTYPFIDRLNMYYKGGAVWHNISFTPEEKSLLTEAGATETWEQVVDLAERLYQRAKDENCGAQKITIDMIDIAGDADGEDAEEIDFGDDDGDIEAGNSVGNQFKPAKKSKNDDDADADDNIPMSKTQEAWDKNQDQIIQNDNTEHVYVTLPEPKLDQIIDDYKVFLRDYDARYGADKNWINTIQAEMTAWKKAENRAISFMVKEFEMRKAADIHARIAIAKTGIINQNKLFGYKYDEDMFKRHAILPKGKNHGFVMFLDWSGSMASNIAKTAKQLFSLVLFCKRVQIPFEVYIFRSASSRNFTSQWKSTGSATIKLSDFKLRNILSSRMKASELHRAMTYLWAISKNGGYSNIDGMSSTPLNQAIVCAPYIVSEFQKRAGVQITNTIFLTDGDSDGFALPPCGLQYDKRKIYIVQDQKTKRNYFLGNTSRSATDVLLKLLKDRTETNLIGFYIVSSFKEISASFDGILGDASARKRFSDNNYLVSYAHGYDHYYFIKMANLEAQGEFSPKEGLSKNRLARAFVEFSEKKTMNRVLLRQFIEQISSVPKKIG